VASKLTTLSNDLPILFTSGYSQDSENVSPAMAEAPLFAKTIQPHDTRPRSAGNTRPGEKAKGIELMQVLETVLSERRGHSRTGKK